MLLNVAINAPFDNQKSVLRLSQITENNPQGFGDLDFRVRSDALWLYDNQQTVIGIADITEVSK